MWPLLQNMKQHFQGNQTYHEQVLGNQTTADMDIAETCIDSATAESQLKESVSRAELRYSVLPFAKHTFHRILLYINGTVEVLKEQAPSQKIELQQIKNIQQVIDYSSNIFDKYAQQHYSTLIPQLQESIEFVNHWIKQLSSTIPNDAFRHIESYVENNAQSSLEEALECDMLQVYQIAHRMQILDSEDLNRYQDAFNILESDPKWQKVIADYKQLEVDQESIEWGACIGSGTFATVSQGKLNGQRCAIKHFDQGLPQDNTVAGSIAAELYSQVRVSHPGIVKILGFSSLKVPFMIFMERGDVSLSSFTDRISTWPLRLSIARQIGEGLQHLHHRNVLHRDVKGSNVILFFHENSDCITAKLCDFGLARYRVGSNSTTTSLDLISEYSVNWSSPEVLLSGRYGRQSEVFSFGMVLSEIATGHKPHGTRSHQQVALAIRGGESPGTPLPGCPQQLQDLISRCIRVDPAQRPRLYEVVQELQHIEGQMGSKNTEQCYVERTSLRGRYLLRSTSRRRKEMEGAINERQQQCKRQAIEAQCGMPVPETEPSVCGPDPLTQETEDTAVDNSTTSTMQCSPILDTPGSYLTRSSLTPSNIASLDFESQAQLDANTPFGEVCWDTRMATQHSQAPEPWGL